MPNYESNGNSCKHDKYEDYCCESNKKDWKDDDCKCDYHDKNHHKKMNVVVKKV